MSGSRRLSRVGRAILGWMILAALVNLFVDLWSVLFLWLHG